MYTAGEQHGNSTSSDIKNTLENWYAQTTVLIICIQTKIIGPVRLVFSVVILVVLMGLLYFLRVIWTPVLCVILVAPVPSFLYPLKPSYWAMEHIQIHTQ